jgi:hypothetical protein
MTSRGIAMVMRPCSWATRKGTFSLDSITTRTVFPLAAVRTPMRGTETFPTSSVRWSARHSAFLRSSGARNRGTESTGTSQRLPSRMTFEERRRRSPSTDARLFRSYRVTLWPSAVRVTAATRGSGVVVTGIPCSSSASGISSASPRTTGTISRRC